MHQYGWFRIEFEVKKDRFYSAGGTRVLKFASLASGDIAQLKASGRTLTVLIGAGLPKNASECVCLYSSLHNTVAVRATGAVLGRQSPSSKQRQLPIWPPLISL